MVKLLLSILRPRIYFWSILSEIIILKANYTCSISFILEVTGLDLTWRIFTIFTYEAMYLSFRTTPQNSCLEAFKACYKNAIIFITTWTLTIKLFFPDRVRCFPSNECILMCSKCIPHFSALTNHPYGWVHFLCKFDTFWTPFESDNDLQKMVYVTRLRS